MHSLARVKTDVMTPPAFRINKSVSPSLQITRQFSSLIARRGGLSPSPSFAARSTSTSTSSSTSSRLRRRPQATTTTLLFFRYFDNSSSRLPPASAPSRSTRRQGSTGSTCSPTSGGPRRRASPGASTRSLCWALSAHAVLRPSAGALLRLDQGAAPDKGDFCFFLLLRSVVERKKERRKTHSPLLLLSFFLFLITFSSHFFLHSFLHPQIALVRVGEFYECIGADAVSLVEHAALNPMGTGPNTMPRAGCPASNLKRTLDDLVRGASLSVVVAEEAPEGYSYGSRARKKERYVAGVVTPAQPHYLVNSLSAGSRSGGGGRARRRGSGGDENFASSVGSSSFPLDDDNDDIDGSTTNANDQEDIDTIDATPPILGVSAVASSSGFTVVEVDVEMRRFSVHRGLTEDAVSARLFSGGLSPPLYLHSPDDSADPRRFADASAEQEWSKRVATLFRQEVGVVKRYGFGGGGGKGVSLSSSSSGSNSNSSSSTSSPSLEPAVTHLLSAVRRDLGLPPNEPFAEVKRGSSSGSGGGGGGSGTTTSAGPQVSDFFLFFSCRCRGSSDIFF